MAGTRKAPKLRVDGKYYVVGIYKPNGKRTNISFGSIDERTEGEIYAAFGKWLDLFNQFPHKVLSFKSPYDAVEELISPTSIITIGELVDKYLAWARKTLQPEGAKRDGDVIIRTKRIKLFLKKYHDWPIDSFGADELKAVQDAMKKYEYKRGKKKAKYTRRGINDNLKQIRTIWGWGVGRELVTHAQEKRLEEVKSLRIGQGLDVPKRPKVTLEEFEKVVKNVNSVIADMLWLIWYTAMRPGEVCKMRPFDILRDDPECWVYIPGRDKTPVGEHKTMRFGRVKVVTLTKKAQEILNRRISDFKSKEYIFKPGDTIKAMYKKRGDNRRTPLNCGNRPGTNRKEHPMIKPGNLYTANALRTACKRGCLRAKVEPFKPYDLRRSTATGTRSILGKEAAKVLLGHAKVDTTNIYLLEEVQEAMKIAKLLASKS